MDGSVLPGCQNPDFVTDLRNLRCRFHLRLRFFSLLSTLPLTLLELVDRNFVRPFEVAIIFSTPSCAYPLLLPACLRGQRFFLRSRLSCSFVFTTLGRRAISNPGERLPLDA